MLLRLTAAEALGRAAFALASVTIAFVGHVELGHGHCDITQLLLAAFLLLFASWRTRNIPGLLVSALGAQVLVHGGMPAQPHMMLVHLAAAAAALVLMTHGEAVWWALARLLIPGLPSMGAVPALTQPSRTALVHRPRAEMFAHGTFSRRGPPIPA